MSGRVIRPRDGSSMSATLNSSDEEESLADAGEEEEVDYTTPKTTRQRTSTDNGNTGLECCVCHAALANSHSLKRHLWNLHQLNYPPPENPFAAAIIPLQTQPPSGMVADTRVRIHRRGGHYYVSRILCKLVPDESDSIDEPVKPIPNVSPYPFSIPPPAPPSSLRASAAAAAAAAPSALFSPAHAAAPARIHARVVFSDDEEDEEEAKSNADREEDRKQEEEPDSDEEQSRTATTTHPHPQAEMDGDSENERRSSSSDEGALDEELEDSDDEVDESKQFYMPKSSNRKYNNDTPKLRAAMHHQLNKSGVANFLAYLAKVKPGVGLLDLEYHELLDLVPNWISTARTLQGGYYGWKTFYGYINSVQRVVKQMEPQSQWAQIRILSHPPVKAAVDAYQAAEKERELTALANTNGEDAAQPRLEMSTRRAERMAAAGNEYGKDSYAYSLPSSASSSPRHGPQEAPHDTPRQSVPVLRSGTLKLSDEQLEFLIAQLDPEVPEGLFRLNWINFARYFGLTSMEDHKTFTLKSFVLGCKPVKVKFEGASTSQDTERRQGTPDDPDSSTAAPASNADHKSTDDVEMTDAKEPTTAEAKSSEESKSMEADGPTPVAASSSSAAAAAPPSSSVPPVDPRIPFEVCEPSDPDGVWRLVNFLVFIPPSANRRHRVGFMYERPWEDVLCPIALWKSYIKHRPPLSAVGTDGTEPNQLWLQPKKHVNPTDSEWYNIVPVGRNKLSVVIGTLTVGCGLPQGYTNLSVIHKPLPALAISQPELESMQKKHRAAGYGLPTKEDHILAHQALVQAQKNQNSKDQQQQSSATPPLLTASQTNQHPPMSSFPTMPPPMPYYPYPPPLDSSGKPMYIPLPLSSPPHGQSYPPFFSSDPRELAEQARYQQWLFGSGAAASAALAKKQEAPRADVAAAPSTVAPAGPSITLTGSEPVDIESAGSLIAFIDRCQGEINQLQSYAATCQKSLDQFKVFAQGWRKENQATLQLAQHRAKIAEQFQLIEEQKHMIEQLKKQGAKVEPVPSLHPVNEKVDFDPNTNTNTAAATLPESATLTSATAMEIDVPPAASAAAPPASASTPIVELPVVNGILTQRNDDSHTAISAPSETTPSHTPAADKSALASSSNSMESEDEELPRLVPKLSAQTPRADSSNGLPPATASIVNGSTAGN